MNEQKYLEIAKNYFKMFSKKDINGLSKIFSENITLRDWNFNGKNKKEVIEINEKIFSSIKVIHIKILSMCFFSKLNTPEIKIFADLEIKDENNNISLVLDILTFKDYKITSIVAYKGN